MPRKIKANPAIADAEIANAQVIEPVRQFRINDIQLATRRAGTNAEHRRQHQKP